MSAKMRFPFLRYGVILVLISLFAFGPLLSAIAADAIATTNGCRMEGADHTCLYGSWDAGDLLHFFYSLGLLTIVTLPLGIVFGLIWLVALGIHMGRFKAKRLPS